MTSSDDDGYYDKFLNGISYKTPICYVTDSQDQVWFKKKLSEFKMLSYAEYQHSKLAAIFDKLMKNDTRVIFTKLYLQSDSFKRIYEEWNLRAEVNLLKDSSFKFGYVIDSDKVTNLESSGIPHRILEKSAKIYIKNVSNNEVDDFVELFTSLKTDIMLYDKNYVHYLVTLLLFEYHLKKYHSYFSLEEKELFNINNKMYIKTLLDSIYTKNCEVNGDILYFFIEYYFGSIKNFYSKNLLTFYMNKLYLWVKEHFTIMGVLEMSKQFKHILEDKDNLSQIYGIYFESLELDGYYNMHLYNSLSKVKIDIESIFENTISLQKNENWAVSTVNFNRHYNMIITIQPVRVNPDCYSEKDDPLYDYIIKEIQIFNSNLTEIVNILAHLRNKIEKNIKTSELDRYILHAMEDNKTPKNFKMLTRLFVSNILKWIQFLIKNRNHLHKLSNKFNKLGNFYRPSAYYNLEDFLGSLQLYYFQKLEHSAHSRHLMQLDMEVLPYQTKQEVIDSGTFDFEATYLSGVYLLNAVLVKQRLVTLPEKKLVFKCPIIKISYSYVENTSEEQGTNNFVYKCPILKYMDYKDSFEYYWDSIKENFLCFSNLDCAEDVNNFKLRGVEMYFGYIEKDND